ncbi:phosphate metabolism protein 7 [Coemansia interrupta]|uniref:Phosphate metabolism protein 7 n=1 Tax=Coemansia interrupta TaxID=1126814 RepID=A0A9W8HL29_9FUNG|nr:phosphate metabolism protein 7 [Coemansia interrupta]
MADESDDTKPTNDTSTFVSSLVFNLVVAAAIIIVFCILRPRFKRVYAPRTYAVAKEKRSPKISKSPLAWISKVMEVRDEQIIARVGLDTYMFLRYMRSMFIVFTVLSLLSVVTILPVNITGGGDAEGISVLTMSNLPPDSPKVWVQIVFFMVFVVWVMKNILGELNVYTRLRLWWLTTPEHMNKVGSSTVMVSTLPETLIEREDRIRQMFDVFPGGVRQIVVNRDCSELADIVKQRDKYALKLEKMLTTYAVNCEKAHKKAAKKGSEYTEPKRPLMRESKIPFKGPKIDAIEFLSTEIARMNQEISELTGDVTKFKRQSSAFVLFRKQIAAHMSAQTVLDYKPLSMNSVSLDVNPEDIIWSNMNMNPYDRRIRGYISFAITVGLVIVWTILTAFLAGLVSVKSLKKIPGLKNIPDSKWLGIFTGIIPSIVLAVLMALLPIILRLLLRLEGTPRVSQVNMRLLHRYYFFQVWNVYLVTILSTTILQTVSEVVKHPELIVKVIATNVPKSANPILTYVLLLAFTGAAKEILQIARLVMRYVMPMIFAKTPRSIAKAETPAEFDWATSIPTHSLIFLMGFSYSFIAPLVNCFVAVYFGLFYVVYRYQFLYVYNDANWSTGGLSFPKSIAQMMVGVYISEVYMLLIMVSRLENSANAIIRVVFTAIIILCTVGVHLYINDAYMPIINYLPIRAAADVEENPKISTKFPDLSSEADLSLNDSSDADSTIESDSKARRRIYAMYGSLVPRKLIDYILVKVPSILHSKSPPNSPDPADDDSNSDIAAEELASEYQDKPKPSNGLSMFPQDSAAAGGLPSMPVAHHYNASGTEIDNSAAGAAPGKRASGNTNILSIDSGVMAAAAAGPGANSLSPYSLHPSMPQNPAAATSHSIHSYTSATELRQRPGTGSGFSTKSHNRRSRFEPASAQLTPFDNDNALAEAFSNPALRAKSLVNLWVPIDNNGLCNELFNKVLGWGNGTIRIITDRTEINEKGKVTADVDFDPENPDLSTRMLTKSV